VCVCVVVVCVCVSVARDEESLPHNTDQIGRLSPSPAGFLPQ